MNGAAKSKLDTLSIQLKKHTAAFDKYTIKKKEVLEIIVKIKSLIQKFNETIGENSGAKKELKELLGVINEMPVFSGELRDDELADVFTELQDIKKKLEGIGGGAGDTPVGETKVETKVEGGSHWERRGENWVRINGGGRKRRKRGGFKFTSNAIKSRKGRYMTRKRKSKSPKRRQKTRKTPKRRKRTRRKRRKGRKSRRKSRRKRLR